MTVIDRRLIKPGGFSARCACCLLLLVLPLGVLGRPLRGEVFQYQDLSAFYFPREAYLAAHGVVGWDPHILLGIGLLGDPQTAPYEPIRAICRAAHVPPASGFVWFVAFYFGVASAGMWAFARRWGCHSLGASFSALVLVGGGIFIVRMRHPWVLPTISVLPWAALLTHNLVRRPRLVTALLLGMVLAIGALGGHPQASYLAWLFVCAYAIVGTMVMATTGPQFARFLAIAWRMAIGALGFCGLLAGYYVPVIAQLRHSPRQTEAGLPFAGSYSWNPWDWLRIFIPDLYGNDMAGSHFGTRNYHEQTFYLGIAPLMLLVLAVLWPSRHRRERLLIYVGGIALVLSAGHWLPPFYAGYFLVPGWRLFRAPCRWLWCVAPCAAALVGLALTRIAQGDRPPEVESERLKARLKWIWICVFGICLAALGIALGWTGLDRSTEPGAGRAMAWGACRAALTLAIVGIAMGAWFLHRMDGRAVAATLVVVTVLDLGLQWIPYRQTKPAEQVYPPRPIVAALASSSSRVLVQAYKNNGEEPVIVPLLNWGEVAGYDDVRGYSQAIDQDVRALLRRGDLDGRLDREPAELAAIDPAEWLLNLIGVNLIAAPVGCWPSRWRLLPVVASAGGWEVRRREGAFRRAWLVDRTVVSTPQAALDALPTLDLTEVATVDQDLGLEVPSAPLNGTPLSPGTAKIVAESNPDEVSVAVDAVRPSLLVFSGRADPGWRATVDGADAPVVRADFLFRGVRIESGVHTVRFSYRTPGRKTGAVITLATAVLMLMLMLTLATRRSARQRSMHPIVSRKASREILARNTDMSSLKRPLHEDSRRTSNSPRIESGRATVANILADAGIEPAPKREKKRPQHRDRRRSRLSRGTLR